MRDYGGVSVMKLPAELYFPATDGRLRIGYLSADFKDHPVAKRMQDVFALHDRCVCVCAHARMRACLCVLVFA